jgi:HJR/Mrr/RecB family endonuclease
MVAAPSVKSLRQLRNDFSRRAYAGSVGIAGVQEALSGMAYYQCAAAWVVTTGTFTPNAVELAEKSSVKLIGRAELGKMIVHMMEQNRNAP